MALSPALVDREQAKFAESSGETTVRVSLPSALQTIITSDFISGMIESPQNKIYALDPSSIDVGRTVTSLQIYTLSGTCTVAIKINGVSITGLSAVAVTSTPQEVAASALNSMVLADVLTLVVSSNAAAIDLVFRVKYTRGT